MGIVQTGTTLQFSINTNANTGTVSSAITVPDDAEKVACRYFRHREVVGKSYGAERALD
jgi:hypothetical protein